MEGRKKGRASIMQYADEFNEDMMMKTHKKTAPNSVRKKFQNPGLQLQSIG